MDSMEDSIMNRLRIALVTSLLLLPAVNLHAQAPSPAPAQDPPQKFEGQIEVREVGVVVDAPDGPSLGSVRPQDIVVFEDGAARTVVKAEPLRPGSPWRIVLAFDRVLARPQTVHDAALALARQARNFTGLGTVEIVTVGPEGPPRVDLAATKDAKSLSSILGEIAGRARKEIRPRREEMAPSAPDQALLRRQLERLTAYLSGRTEGGARALFLVADSFIPHPSEAGFLAQRDPNAPVPPGTLAAALRESSRALAASGWITFAGPLSESRSERERISAADMERLRTMGGGSDLSNAAPPVVQMPPEDRGPRGDARVVDVYSRPDSAPWLALSQPTAGTVLGVEAQLATLIDSLARRWMVWYQAPEAADGKLRTLEVRLPGAGEPLRSPRWVRSAAGR